MEFKNTNFKREIKWNLKIPKRNKKTTRCRSEQEKKFKQNVKTGKDK